MFFNLPKNYNGKTPLTLSFEDASGKTIRSFSLHPKDKKARKYKPWELTAMDAITVANYRNARDTVVEPGMNSFVWDMRYPSATEIVGQHIVPTDDFRDNPDGPTTLPGDYTVVLNYGGNVMKQPLTIKVDPRLTPPADALQARLSLAQELWTTLDTLDKTVNAALAKRGSIPAGKRAELDKAIAAVYEANYRSSEADIMNPSKLRDHLAFLMNSLDLAYQAPTAAERDAAKELEGQANDAIAQIKSLAGL